MSAEPADSAGRAFAERAHAAVAAVPEFQGAIEPALRWAAELGSWVPAPGTGRTAALWEFLSAVAAEDVAVARVLEPHLDALAILSQASVSSSEIGADSGSTWGVFASAAPGTTVRALPRPGTEGWLLDGVKMWCSLAGSLSHALVTAPSDDGAQMLFAVSLDAPGVTAESGPWAPRGLTQLVSAAVRFDRAPAIAVGEPGWYLERPGFFWGGIGVAACWLGGARGVARALLAAAQSHEPDPLTLMHLGAVDALLATGRELIASAARVVDDPSTPPDTLPLLMLRTRNTIASIAEQVIEHVGHALGPAPLIEERHARRVADLQLYLRQHHAERDDAALGRAILSAPERAAW